MPPYEEIASSHIVMPIAVETLGSWADMGLKFMKDLGARIDEQTGEKSSTNFLFQSIGIAIQRGNAACVMGTAPSAGGLEGLFDFVYDESIDL